MIPFVKFNSLVAAVLVLLLLGGCTSPYGSRPVIEQPGSPQAQSFPGLTDLFQPRATAHVIWTHGMCSHDDGWVENRIKLLNVALGTSDTRGHRQTIGNDGAYIYPVTFAGEQGSLQIQFLMWSPLTRSAKAALNFDKSGNDPTTSFPYQRASLNNSLKAGKIGLMNDCLADVVVYSGRNGDAIRTAMADGVCRGLGGLMGQGGKCDVSGADDHPLAIVTESLGSKLVADAIRTIWDDTQSGPAPMRAALAARVASIGAVYMLANQLPLLNLAGGLPDLRRRAQAARTPVPTAAAAAKSPLADILELIALSRPNGQTTPARPLLIVAFTDPNDLLSYRLLPEPLGLDAARLINVIISNDNTLLGYFARPDTAHCGYAWNPNVVGLLTQGYRANAAAPAISVPADLSEACF